MPDPTRPILAVTMGDPSGTGPELITRALVESEVLAICRPVVIGDAAVLEQATSFTRSPARIQRVDTLDAAAPDERTICILDLENVDLDRLELGVVQSEAGQAAFEYIRKAAELALAGEAAAIVTNAINKEALNNAGHHYDGHTGLLAHLCQTPGATMMLAADKLRVSHVSTHVSLREAIDRVRPERILKVLELTRTAVQRLGVKEPKIAVAGLNPHAGEHGLFGDEEATHIQPAIEQARARGWNVSGPYPGDTVFFRAMNGEFDAAVAMYHDQGHVAVKMLGIWKGVNVTLGLPIIRTSVEHGTNFDLAGTGRSDPRSLLEALKLAARLALLNPFFPLPMSLLRPLLLLPLLSGLVACAREEKSEPTPPAPLFFDGSETANTNADGGLRWAVGTHAIQVVRGNRTHPTHLDGLNHTYLHAPMLAYWNERFYLAYLSGPVNEHDTPTDTSYCTSRDGVHWEPPRLLFPAYELPDGSMTLTHQRMVWYTAPSGRLLATAFHGEAPNPNQGEGIGRVVREVYADGSLGPIFFIRYNQHPEWDRAKAEEYPFFTDAKDTGFVEACEALLADKLMTAQWWEEDRSEDGFYRVKGKALSFFHRLDGLTVGVWKDAQLSTSDDEGASWTRHGFIPGLEVNGSKYWAHRTDDGKFALVYNPTTRLRHPLAVMLSDDGQRFSQLLTIHGELPDQRFPGRYKNMGPQYVRGIAEGNGNPPDDDMWLTYSVNKEDIWVSRTPTPITAEAPAPAAAEFEATAPGQMPAAWNIYRPLWASVQVADGGDDVGHVLELKDEDPYDYASATRIFPACRSVRIAFKFLARQTNGRLEIDISGPHGLRPVQVALTPGGGIEARHEGIWKPAGTFAANDWVDFVLEVNPGNATEKFRVLVNGQPTLYRDAYFTDYIPKVERLTFRTGPYRRRGQGGHELAGADDRVPASTFLLDDITFEIRPE